MKDFTVSASTRGRRLLHRDQCRCIRGMSGQRSGTCRDVVGTVRRQPARRPGVQLHDRHQHRDIHAGNGVPKHRAWPTALQVGLTDYFAGRYHKAAKDFDQVLALELTMPSPARRAGPLRTLRRRPCRSLRPRIWLPVPLLIGVGLLMLSLSSGVASGPRARAPEATAMVVINGSGGTLFTSYFQAVWRS
jgi:hypothetical protein